MQRVEIHVEGCLDRQWFEWFEGLEITQTAHGEMVIRGDIIDQAALYGLFGKLRDLGARLLTIRLDQM